MPRAPNVKEIREVDRKFIVLFLRRRKFVQEMNCSDSMFKLCSVSFVKVEGFVICILPKNIPHRDSGDIFASILNCPCLKFLIMRY